MTSIITRTACPCCGSNAILDKFTCEDFTVSHESFSIWECNNCTLLFTQAVPEQKAMEPYYKSEAYISHTDSEKGIANKIYKLARRYTLKWKLNLIKVALGKEFDTINILDIGCGTGAFLNGAVEAGWHVTGLEPDDGARKVCRDKYQIEAEVPSKLFELPAQHFDVVTLWHVLEHVHQLHEYMAEIKRVLKPGGMTFIALPNYTSSDAAFYHEYWAAYDVPRHLYHFSPIAVNKLVEQHKMKTAFIKPMWLDAFYIALLSEGYKKGNGNLVTAFSQGLLSNLKASTNKSLCSSLVYVIKHDD